MAQTTDPFLVLAFRNIPPTGVTRTGEGLRFDVARSAGLVLYRLPEAARIRRVTAAGRVEGSLGVTAATQGQRGADDHALKIGLVESGSRRPSMFERWFAPAWLKQLFALAPPNTGIGGVWFLTLGVDAVQVARSRIHPLHRLLHERVVAAPDASGRFAIDASVEVSGRVLALWLASDGDDSGSAYRTVLERVALEDTSGRIHAVPVTAP